VAQKKTLYVVAGKGRPGAWSKGARDITRLSPALQARARATGIAAPPGGWLVQQRTTAEELERCGAVSAYCAAKPAKGSSSSSSSRASWSRASDFRSWAHQLDELEATFAGAVGENLLRYVLTLHKRIRARFETVRGFLDWEHGAPRRVGEDAWEVRVWQKVEGTYPGTIAPNLLVKIEFSRGVHVALLMGNTDPIFPRRFFAGDDADASTIGLRLGEAWERRLTGTVEYGRD
jgi:hypothetical protein